MKKNCSLYPLWPESRKQWRNFYGIPDRKPVGRAAANIPHNALSTAERGNAVSAGEPDGMWKNFWLNGLIGMPIPSATK